MYIPKNLFELKLSANSLIRGLKIYLTGEGTKRKLITELQVTSSVPKYLQGYKLQVTYSFIIDSQPFV